jgi:hypothetical protein
MAERGMTGRGSEMAGLRGEKKKNRGRGGLLFSGSLLAKGREGLIFFFL